MFRHGVGGHCCPLFVFSRIYYLVALSFYTAPNYPPPVSDQCSTGLSCIPLFWQELPSRSHYRVPPENKGAHKLKDRDTMTHQPHANIGRPPTLSSRDDGCERAGSQPENHHTPGNHGNQLPAKKSSHYW